QVVFDTPVDPRFCVSESLVGGHNTVLFCDVVQPALNIRLTDQAHAPLPPAAQVTAENSLYLFCGKAMMADVLFQVFVEQLTEGWLRTPRYRFLPRVITFH